MKRKVDYLIVGAGPAGLQLAYDLQKKGLDCLIIERDEDAGATFKKHPRHRLLISINKVFTGFDDTEVNLRWDWNSILCDNQEISFTDYTHDYFPSPDDLLAYLKDYAEKFKLNIDYKKTVKKISRDGDFLVETEQGDLYQAKRLIMATGVSLPYTADIPGIETAVNYCDMSLDKKEFQNKHVLVIGKGNSGFETADYLVDSASIIHIASPTPLTMAWRSRFVGHLRAVNNNFLDTYKLKSRNAVINADIEKIEYKDDKYTVTFGYHLADGEREKLVYDKVLVCTGFKFDDSMFDESCKPEMKINNRFPAQQSWYESTNIKDLFFAGTIMQQRDYKQKQSGFIHGFRYNVRFLANYLEFLYENRPLSSTLVSPRAEVLTEKVISIVNKSSGLWQQTGYICDALVWSKADKAYRHYGCLPTDFMPYGCFKDSADYFVLTLELGQEQVEKFPDVFAIDRVHKEDINKAHLSTEIHPVVCHYRNGQLVAIHHVIEDLMGVWEEAVHIKPLTAFFAKALKGLLQTEVIRREVC